MAVNPTPESASVPRVAVRRSLVAMPAFWLGLAVAIVGLSLAFLSLPGVLLYPRVVPPPVVDAGPDEQALALQRQHNQSLREQIEQAQRLLSQNVCRKDGALFVPSAPPIGGPASQAQAPRLSPVPPEEAGRLVPTPAERILTPARAGGAAPAGAPRTLPDLLDRATVLVLVPGKGLGSGFFLAPDLIVTNRHVVDGAGSGVFVTNKALGGLKRAEVKSMTGGALTPGGPDFALLAIEAQRDAPVLPLTDTVERLQRVIAAGFPGLITQADDKFEALRQGDRTAIPEMALTNGTVTVVQNRSSGSVIGHEAMISPGNSGGPLVDECVRIVGINTYGQYDATGRHHVNYALAVTGLAEFLRGQGLTPTLDSAPCRPGDVRVADETAAATPTRPAAAPGAPAPKATP